MNCFILDFGCPTSLDFVQAGINHVVVSYNTARTLVYDTETGQSVLSLDSAVTYGKFIIAPCFFYRFGIMFRWN